MDGIVYLYKEQLQKHSAYTERQRGGALYIIKEKQYLSNLFACAGNTPA